MAALNKKRLAAVDALIDFIAAIPANPSAKTHFITENQIQTFRGLDSKFAGLNSGNPLSPLPCSRPLYSSGHYSAPSMFGPASPPVYSPPRLEAELIGYTQLHVMFCWVVDCDDYVERMKSFRAALLIQAGSEPQKSSIKPDKRTIPLTLRRAAKLLGKTGSPKDAAEWLKASIGDGEYQAEQKSRQNWVFNIDAFPEAVHSLITPQLAVTGGKRR